MKPILEEKNVQITRFQPLEINIDNYNENGVKVCCNNEQKNYPNKTKFNWKTFLFLLMMKRNETETVKVGLQYCQENVFMMLYFLLFPEPRNRKTNQHNRTLIAFDRT